MKRLMQKLLGKFGYSLRKTSRLSSPSSTQILCNLFRRDEKIIIFDVGAHRGESAKSYRKFFDNAEIYSFEPFKESFEILQKIDITKFKPFNIGLSDKKSVERFCLNKGSATNSLLKLTEDAKNTWGGNVALSQAGMVDCHFTTFDEFCNENSIQHVDFMKIDVQGAEFRVLKGAHAALSEKRIKVLQLEVIIGDTYDGQKSLAYYIGLLEGYGYKLKMFADLVAVEGSLVQTDVFFSST